MSLKLEDVQAFHKEVFQNNTIYKISEKVLKQKIAMKWKPTRHYYESVMSTFDLFDMAVCEEKTSTWVNLEYNKQKVEAR